jgi:hypothetical protein
MRNPNVRHKTASADAPDAPVFDAGEITKMAAGSPVVPKIRDATDADLVREFLLKRGVTRLTKEEQEACDARSNERKEGRKHVEAVVNGWSSQRPPRALPKLAEIAAIEGWGPVFTPPVEPMLMAGQCANCRGPIKKRAGTKKKRAGTKFCGRNCEQIHRRARNDKILANLTAVISSEATAAAREMERFSKRAGIEGVTFLGTPAGVLVDGQMPELVFEDARDRRPDNRVEVHETEHLVSDPDILTMVLDLRQRQVARSREYDRDYMARFGPLLLAPVDTFLTGPDRKVKLLAFAPGLGELRCRQPLM